AQRAVSRLPRQREDLDQQIIFCGVRPPAGLRPLPQYACELPEPAVSLLRENFPSAIDPLQQPLVGREVILNCPFPAPLTQPRFPPLSIHKFASASLPARKAPRRSM